MLKRSPDKFRVTETQRAQPQQGIGNEQNKELNPNGQGISHSGVDDEFEDNGNEMASGGGLKAVVAALQSQVGLLIMIYVKEYYS